MAGPRSPAPSLTLQVLAACSQLADRGFLAREGCRLGEALALTWDAVDLKRGTLRLDTNKTDDPRMWVLDPGVAAALREWRKRRKKAVQVFDAPPGMHAAEAFREDLKAQGLTGSSFSSALRTGSRSVVTTCAPRSSRLHWPTERRSSGSRTDPGTGPAR